MEVASGGYANVSQGTYEGRRVAIKVVRVYITSDLDLILSVSLLLRCHDYMGEYVTEILPRGGSLEAPPASEHLTTDWGDSEQPAFRDGFDMDGEWEYQ